MTDITKYKSVAVRLPIWNKLQSIAGEDFRSVGKVIEYLVDKEGNTITLLEDLPEFIDSNGVYTIVPTSGQTANYGILVKPFPAK